MLHVASTLVLFLILAGLRLRRRPAWHIALMSCAFLTDLALVLYIELTRHAVEEVVHRARPLVYVHAAISLAVLVNYVVMIVLGSRVLTGRRASRATHRTMGTLFVVLRSLNYVTALVM